VLATRIGLLYGEFVPTDEMLGGWPGLLDLLVAFVSGLAAAYATSRPDLFAALPDVAIAAVAGAADRDLGLAASRGDFVLAYGAFLLFFTDMAARAKCGGCATLATCTSCCRSRRRST
jgi:uncharacterized membrane protein